MGSAGAVGRPGFRRWYARRLYLAFAWLTTCLLCGVLVTAILELVGLGGGLASTLLALGALYVAGLLAVESFRRFWATLAHAQRCANAATCAACGAYGRFPVLLDADQIPAICNDCGHRWRIR